LIVASPAQNLVEAASNGAIAAIKVVSSVAANLIAILGLIAFLNAALSYLGGCVGVPELSFKVGYAHCAPTSHLTDRHRCFMDALDDFTFCPCIRDILYHNS